MALSLKLLLNFLKNLHTHHGLSLKVKSLIFVVFGLPENVFGSQKCESRHFFFITNMTARFYKQHEFLDEPHFYQKVFNPRPPFFPNY